MIPFVVAGAGLAAYASSFRGVFLLDDILRIVDNPQIRHLWPPWQVMAGATRPVVELSLALNYAVGRLDVWGYHAFNVTVHLLAGVTLFGLVHRMFRSARLRARYGQPAPWLAMAVALLWLLHPIQTESVTYIIQRAESLMGLFYLLTLYCGSRGVESQHPGVWYTASVAACALGMGSKEVMASAPIMMLLYDRSFLAESYREIFRRRWGLYAGLAATWVILGVSLATSREEEQAVLITGLTPWRYAVTQFGVIVHYLRLSVWPHPLILDYTWPLADHVSSVLPWAAVVGVLLAGTILALLRQAWPGFWGAWFFLILAPSSTVFPLADVAFEHRMYLPLAAVVVMVVTGSYEALWVPIERRYLRRGLAVGALLLAVVVLGAATMRRNEVYRNEIAMWRDIAARRPDNPRAHLSLGIALEKQGETTEAIGSYLTALRLKPDYADTHNNLGVALYRRGQTQEAITHFNEAVRLNPRSSEAYRNLGAGLLSEGQADAAIASFEQALRLNPYQAEAHNNLGAALGMRGRMTEAIAHFEEAVRIKPDFAEAHGNLGRALLNQGRLQEAIPHLETALRLDPNSRGALDDLRTIQANQTGRTRLGQPAR